MPHLVPRSLALILRTSLLRKAIRKDRVKHKSITEEGLGELSQHRGSPEETKGTREDGNDLLNPVSVSLGIICHLIQSMM